MADESTHFRIRCGADPVRLTFLRAGLDRWLAGLDWPDEARADVVRAVGDSCASLARDPGSPDGEPPEVEIVGRLVVGPATRQVAVTVRDLGVPRTGSTVTLLSRAVPADPEDGLAAAE